MKSKLLYTVLGFCFILHCLLSASAASGDADFICDNGARISATKKCDGIRHCLDDSDETFLACHKSQCAENPNLFRCAYGGCIPKALKCNGKSDCWDQSDEHQFECGSSEEIETYMEHLRGSCSKIDDFQCAGKDGECISLTQICDGIADCADGDDETSELCSGLKCPSYAFRCAYGACIRAGGRCNHEQDCFDGSDELKQICLEGSNDKNWYVVPANYNISMESCRIGSVQNGMVVRDYFKNKTCSSDAFVEHKGLVRFSCPKGYQLVGESHNVCHDGKWQLEWPSCVSICDGRLLSLDPSLSVSCKYNNRLVECHKTELFVGTEVQLSCARGYNPKKAERSSSLLVCSDSLTWTASPEELQCVPDCGRISNTQVTRREKPWLVSIFQRGYRPTYSFRCLGTIVTPSVVVTAGVCFTNSVDGLDPLDHISYIVAEGKELVEFQQNDMHGYQLHNISQIQVSQYTDPRSRANISLAILRLIKPLTLSATVKPICLQKEEGSKSVVMTLPRSQAMLGQPVSVNKEERAYLKSVVFHVSSVLNATAMSVQPFIKDIELLDKRQKP